MSTDDLTPQEPPATEGPSAPQPPSMPPPTMPPPTGPPSDAGSVPPPPAPPASGSGTEPPAADSPTPPTAPGTQAVAEQPNTEVLVLKDKVQRYLADLVGGIQLTPAGDFTFQFGSARVFVSCVAWGEGDTLVRVSAPILFEVKPSPELYEHIATHSDDWVFGHLWAQPQDDGTIAVMFTHTLLGDFLDPEELKRAVGGVIGTADQLDDELKTRFGGKRFHDDVA